MHDIELYVVDFFETLNMVSDKEEGHSYKAFLSSAIYEFLNEETKDKAYDFFSIFFDVYRVKTAGRDSFIDLLDVLQKYEQSAFLTEIKQRDHYVHSVNVFILGLCIYSQSQKFREIFYLKHKKEMVYSTAQEEFVFRWGVASLFHDIGYPVEIISHQITKFISFIADKAGGKNEVKPYISYMHFEKLNCINELDLAKINYVPFLTKCNNPDIDLLRPTDLLVYALYSRFALPVSDLKIVLDNYLFTMQQSSFVDHGFYSALIVLKWYGEMIQQNSDPTDLFYNQILDSASAIFLHNAYRNILQKDSFALGKLHPNTHPIAYLLILCDEAQEWNRSLEKQSAGADKSKLHISEDWLKLHYVTKKGFIAKELLEYKKALFDYLLDIESVFKEGVQISATTLTEQLIETIKDDDFMPRPLINHIELLAKAIHENYNELQKKRNPEKPLEHPTWESLPDVLKYSNVRQAMSLTNKLKIINCLVAENGDESKLVASFSEAEIECLSEYEHELWVKERLQNGWSYGGTKDVLKKTSPYLVPYSELTEEIKELDRDTIKNIIPLLASIDLKVYRE